MPIDPRKARGTSVAVPPSQVHADDGRSARPVPVPPGLQRAALLLDARGRVHPVPRDGVRIIKWCTI